MDSTLQFLAAAVAACASLTAVVLGIDQLSSGGRLRNLENVLRAVSAMSDDTERHEVVESLHRTTLARLIAREAVPFRAFLVPLFMVVLPLSTLVLTAIRQDLPGPWWSAGLMVLLGSVLVGGGVGQALNLTRERARLRLWFEQGRVPLRAFTDFPSRVSGPRSLFAVTFGGSPLVLVSVYCLVRAVVLNTRSSLGFTLLCVSLASAAAVFVLGTVSRSVVTADLDTEPSSRDSHLRPSWVHPSNPTTPQPLGLDPDPPITGSPEG